MIKYVQVIEPISIIIQLVIGLHWLFVGLHWLFIDLCWHLLAFVNFHWPLSLACIGPINSNISEISVVNEEIKKNRNIPDSCMAFHWLALAAVSPHWSLLAIMCLCWSLLAVMGLHWLALAIVVVVVVVGGGGGGHHG